MTFYTRLAFTSGLALRIKEQPTLPNPNCREQTTLVVADILRVDDLDTEHAAESTDQQIDRLLLLHDQQRLTLQLGECDVDIMVV
jgi:hypothetical protein